MIEMKIEFTVKDKISGEVLTKEEALMRGYLLTPTGKLVKLNLPKGLEIKRKALLDASGMGIVYYVNLPDDYKIQKISDFDKINRKLLEI